MSENIIITKINGSIFVKICQSSILTIRKIPILMYFVSSIHIDFILFFVKMWNLKISIYWWGNVIQFEVSWEVRSSFSDIPSPSVSLTIPSLPHSPVLYFLSHCIVDVELLLGNITKFHRSRMNCSGVNTYTHMHLERGQIEGTLFLTPESAKSQFPSDPQIWNILKPRMMIWSSELYST